MDKWGEPNCQIWDRFTSPKPSYLLRCRVPCSDHCQVPLAISHDIVINLGLPLTESYKPVEACHAAFLTSFQTLAIVIYVL